MISPFYARLLLTIHLAALTGTASELRIVPGLVTTTPVTQNRDKAIYDWETRHGEILKRLPPGSRPYVPGSMSAFPCFDSPQIAIG